MSEGKNYIDKTEFEKYLRGELRGEVAHNFEKKMLESYFASEALEGSESVRPTDFSNDMDLLNTRLASRVEAAKSSISWYQTTVFKVAASVLLLAGISFVVYQNLDGFEFNNQLATDTEQTKDILPIEEPEESKTDLMADSTAIALNALPKEEELTEPPTSAGPVETFSPQEEAVDNTEFETVEEDSFEDAQLDEITEATPLAAISPEEEDKEVEIDPSKSTGDELITGTIAGEPINQPQQAASRSSSTIIDSYRKTIRGKVFGKSRRAPLQGVAVAEAGTGNGVVTDENGEYEITVSGDDPQLNFNYSGYMTTSLDVADTIDVDVVLNALYGMSSKVDYVDAAGNSESITLAIPEGGLNAFTTYLNGRGTYPSSAITDNLTGTVVVTFSIGTDGSLSNFTVERSLSNDCDQEVIRLIRQGPSWTPTVNGTEQVSQTMRVTVDFKQN